MRIVAFLTERPVPGPGGLSARIPVLQLVTVADVPVAIPLVAADEGAFLADRDNRLWIRTGPAPSAGAAPIYDVVNRAGLRVDRVQLPARTIIVGFGVGQSIYLAVRQGDGMLVERVRER